MDETIDMRFGRERFLSVLTICLGGIGFAVAIAGLYALMLRTTSDRIREFGLRLALGARPAGLLVQILRRAVVLAACGIAAGILASLGVFTVIQPFLFEVRGSDPRVFAITTLSVMGVAVMASLAPALRAIRIDPSRVLRED
jgi:putative ABC transport system permease protein